MTQIIFIPGVYFLCTTAKQCQLCPSHLWIHDYRCDIYAILILFSDLFVCLTKSFRWSPVVLAMFLYFDYYNGNPLLVSSDGMRHSFRVQSKSNCCLSYGHMGGMRLRTNFAAESRVVTWSCGDRSVSKETYCVAYNLPGVWRITF